MLGVNTLTYAPDNFFAGEFPIVKDSGTIKTGTTVRKHAPIIMGDTGIEEVTAATLANIVGIAADEPNGGEVVYYLTGEFFADAITLPDGVAVETLKPALRKLGIFLK